ncbi:MAG: cysteine synthase A [Methanomassiliicoccus sp.]|nr:cysteine synthase A [Methanomassiliicoccus sp.]
MVLYNNILEAIGHTPLVRLNRVVPEGSSEIYAKVESFNPMHSIKDRVALSMMEDAERRGVLAHGMYVVEPTSGNTGIGLAMVCAAKGYRLVITMPESMSVERRNLLKALGAELLLTPAAEGMAGAIRRAEGIVASDPKAYMPQQFENPANPLAHYSTTAREILADLPDLNALVATVGTGGTIAGVGKLLKETTPGIKVIGVEPSASPVLSGGSPGPHGIQGIGAGFIPRVYDADLVDRVMGVADMDAAICSRELAIKEGIFCGLSSGAAMSAALKVARELGPGRKVVAILPDTGERYLTTELMLKVAAMK